MRSGCAGCGVGHGVGLTQTMVIKGRGCRSMGRGSVGGGREDTGNDHHSKMYKK